MSRTLEEVRSFGREHTTISAIYVTDEGGVLIDALPVVDSRRFLIGVVTTVDEKPHRVARRTRFRAPDIGCGSRSLR